jgi:solute:Na+ symporter, SSS family
MGLWDYVVLAGYFVIMAGIGVWTMYKIKHQEDYFIGGRGFGKILQTFAAFGAGTGSGDPIATASTTYHSGASGVWAMMTWLFCTPFYWMAAVWYRRMRHITLGDWFVERYDSKSLGGAYAIFGVTFYIFYSAFLFAAVGKFAEPLVASTWSYEQFTLSQVLIPTIAVVVIIYSLMGGLIAAYWTDLIQGLCIILLSVLLIPFGLNALVETYAPGNGMMHGFNVMNERIPDAMLDIFGSARASEFPPYRIAAVACMLLLGIVTLPHMIATGGGSAKKEIDARVGLVTGNMFKRLCTIGWMLTALIILALMAGDARLQADPDQAWGVATMELFKNAPGLTGLMLACLLAALMSSVSCYQIVSSGLIVRNLYKPYLRPNASDKEGLLVARCVGLILVAGAAVVALRLPDVLALFYKTIDIGVLFAPALWLGLYWRKATKSAAWTSFLFATIFFFVLPMVMPRLHPDLMDNQSLTAQTQLVITETTHKAMPADVDKRNAEIAIWEEKAGVLSVWQEAFDNTETDAERTELGEAPADPGPKKDMLVLDDEVTTPHDVGGQAIFWESVVAVDASGEPIDVERVEVARNEISESDDDEKMVEIFYQYPEGTQFKGEGKCKTDMLPLVWLDMTEMSPAALDTLSRLPKIILPFVVMILISIVTPKVSKEKLDRYYVKMLTPVAPSPEEDLAELEKSYADPSRFDHDKLLPGTNFEGRKPTFVDIFGFLLTLAGCFGIIALAWLITQLPSMLAG